MRSRRFFDRAVLRRPTKSAQAERLTPRGFASAAILLIIYDASLLGAPVVAATGAPFFEGLDYE
jgi:hypothetical protein